MSEIINKIKAVNNLVEEAEHLEQFIKEVSNERVKEVKIIMPGKTNLDNESSFYLNVNLKEFKAVIIKEAIRRKAEIKEILEAKVTILEL